MWENRRHTNMSECWELNFDQEVKVNQPPPPHQTLIDVILNLRAFCIEKDFKTLSQGWENVPLLTTDNLKTGWTVFIESSCEQKNLSSSSWGKVGGQGQEALAVPTKEDESPGHHCLLAFYKAPTSVQTNSHFPPSFRTRLWRASVISGVISLPRSPENSVLEAGCMLQLRSLNWKRKLPESTDPKTHGGKSSTGGPVFFELL